ncbi:MAG TPA: DUF1499 domain-containing protein [Burkholderiales bacterium]|nr:DUF1499 domain-containing protein [Burkholderiales bacterium]
MDESAVYTEPTFVSRVRGPAWIALVGFALAALAAVSILVGGWGNRAGWWDYRFAFTVLRWAAWIGLGAGLLAGIGGTLAIAGAPPRRVSALALAGVVLGALVFGIPWAYTARRSAPINDITTDTANPPRYVDIAPLRAGAPAKMDYGGEETAAIQRKAYPDIAPATLGVPRDQAFERALAAARSLGWTIVASVPAEGRIEATDSTLFMGFTDDIVIRVQAEGTGSRVDVRSHSRVGRGDFGTNAKRVRAFLAKLGR